MSHSCKKFRISFLGSLLCFIVVAIAADVNTHTVSPDLAMQRLKEGNRRYNTNPRSAPKETAARREETSQTQRPFAVIVGCADSRVPPEIVFEQNLGDLFVIRTAGNLVDDFALGSVEYAVEHLGTRLVVVLGHEGCGAVKAAVAGGKASGHVKDLVKAIKPAVKAAKEESGDFLANAIRKNAEFVADRIRKQAKLGEAASPTRIVTAYYDLDTGEILWPETKEAK